jgi:hypothetical protein
MFLAIAAMGTETYAGCIPLGGGGQYCASWIVGSTEILGHAKGLAKLDCTAKGSELVCPGMLAEVFGTVDDPNDPGCIEDELDPKCLIAVTALCGPKKCAKNPGGKGCTDNVSVNSSHFGKSDIPVQKDLFDQCRHNGSCKGLLTFLEEAGALCQGQGHVLINALANPFKGRGCYCPGGFDNLFDCCSTGERDASGLCLETIPDGELECTAEFCEFIPFDESSDTNLNGKPDTGEFYDCGALVPEA